jgi:flotillin
MALGLGLGIGIPLVVIVLIAYLVWAARYVKVGPNRALIVVGRPRAVVDPVTGRRSVVGYRIVKGGGTFVRPIRERTYELSLELTTIKIGGDEQFIERAAEQFLGRPREEVARLAFETLEGHLRAVTGTTMLEDIYLRRDRLARAARDAAADDLAAMGLEIVSLTVRGISDTQGYLEAMGRPRIAQAKRDAVIGESEADRVAQQARFEAEAKIERYHRDLELSRTAYEAEVRSNRAEADLAYDLAHNRVAKQVRRDEIDIEIAAEEKMIDLAERAITRKEKNLQAEVGKTAEAERFRIEQLAEAERRRRTVEAEGSEAEIRARADYNQAAVAEMFVKILPELAEKVAAPLARTDKIVVVNTGGDGSGAAGASRVTGDVAAVLGQLPAVIESLTGMSLDALFERLPKLRAPEGATPAAPPADVPSQSAPSSRKD